MPKQLNIDLRFNADTSQAKKQIQDLQASLTKLGTSSTQNLSFDKMNSELVEATSNVNILKTQLERAFNTNTGKLDLTRFNQEMQRSGMTLEKYQKSLMALGPEGSQAFAKLATAISQADIPLMRTNKLLTEMGTVLKNTIKWQISSSAIHGFMGAIQQAYGYAQDLNESLTNIRIVTGQSTEQMATFAAQANQAARALSTTTTAYTDAALIFYQQGLDDQAVKERTDATIKMAQVTGDSAQEVSSYMTAIWNNFDDGSESLEHYADVITALGAATASSSAEISQGLEKFASIADTVGLSYEYATTALATVVAQTRQSADVVGTAFKTMFARIQDLELGKTLEDGVDLGQYSKALAKVGVDVMDTNGQLRAMDDILDDIGQRWGELGEAERVALAQNVAGQRQYAQFMAIFENWDTFQENLSVANTANGTLQEQADIYAKSWEASQKRVKAAMEGIYQSIIDDDFFITLNDGLASALRGVNNLIKAFGGVPGVLSVIGTLMTKYFGNQMAEGIRNIAQNIMMLTKGGREKVQSLQTEALSRAQTMFSDDSVMAQAEKMRLTLQQDILSNAEKLNEFETQAVKLSLQQVDALKQQIAEREEVKNLADKELEDLTKQQTLMAKNKGLNSAQRNVLSDVRNAYYDSYMSQAKTLKTSNIDLSQALDIQDKLPLIQQSFSDMDIPLSKIKENIKNITSNLELSGEAAKNFQIALNPKTNRQDTLKYLNKALGDIPDKLTSVDVSYERYLNILTQVYGSEDKAREALDQYTASIDKNVEAELSVEEALKRYEVNLKSIQNYMATASGNTIDWAKGLVGLANGLMQISMVANNLKGIFDVWNNEDMSFGEKMLSTFTSLGMVIPIVITGIRTLTAEQTKNAIANALVAGSEKLVLEAKLRTLGVEGAEKAKVIELIISKKLLTKETLSESEAEELNTLAKILNIDATKLKTGTTLQAAVAEKIFGTSLTTTAAQIAAATGAILILVAAIAAFVAACKFAYEAYNADAIAAEKSAKAAANLTNAYNEATQAYEDLKNTISNYEEGLNALKELTKGTQEYRDALIEANNAAMALIENGDLNATDYQWEGDQLIIDEEAITQAQANAQSQMLQAQAAMRMGQVSANQAANQADLTAIRRSDDGLISNDVQNAIGATLLNSAGGSAGFYANLASTLFTGDTLGNHFYDSQMSSEWEQQAEIERLAESYKILGEGAFEGSELFENASEEMQNSIRNYCQEVAETANIMTAYSQDIAHANLDIEEYSEGAIDAAASAFADEYQTQYETRLAETRDRIEQISTEADQDAQDLWDEYRAASGLNAQLVGVEGDDANRSFTYYDENHELQHVYAQEIAASLATADALDELSKAAKNAQNFLDSLNEENLDFYEQALTNFSDGHVNFSNFAGQYIANSAEPTDIDAWNTIYNAGTEEDMSAYIDEAVEEGLAVLEAYGIETTDELHEMADALGIEYTELFNDLMQGYANEMDSFAHYINEQSVNAVKYFNNEANFEDLTHQQTRSILDAYSIAENNGANEQLESLFSDMDSNTMVQFAEQIESIDWESITPRQFIQDLKTSGFEIEGFEDVLVRFCDSMRTVTADTLAATAEFYNGLQKIADGLSDQSDEISAEDFASLPEDMRQFFALTIDGTYKLLKTARDFQDYVEQSRIAEAIDNRNALYSQYQELGKTMSDEDFAKGGGGAQEAYNQYLAADMAIALHYDDLSELQQAYAEGTVETIEAFNTAAYQIDQAQDTAMLDQEAWQNYSDYIREAGSALEGFNNEMDDLEADIVAKSIMKMNQAVETLSSNFDEWRDVLENSTEASAEYADALIGTRKAIAMLLDISEDYVSSDFVTEHLDLIAQAAEGDAEAIDQLRVELSQDVGSMLASAVSSTEADAAKIESWLNKLTAQALAFDDLEIGASLYLNGKDGFVEALNEMIAATGMTVDQVNALCDSMGFEANFASESQEIKTQIPVYRIHHEVQDEGGKPLGEGQPVPHSWSEITWTEQLPDEEASTYAPAFAMTTDGTTPKINSVTKKPSGSANNLSSSNRGGGKSSSGGGGGKSSSQKKPKDPTGEVERYHVINNQIEDNEKALDRLSKAKDRAYGKAKLNAMDAEIAKQRESVELAERKLQEVEEYLKLDSGAIAAFGAEFDANGTIVNYDQLMQEQIDKYNAAVEAYNNSSMDENADAVFQQAEDDYNAFTEALKQYEETQDLWYEQAQAVADAKAEVLQLELEKTNYKVEIGIEWEEEDIARLDFMLKRIEDDAHKAAEAIGLLGERTVDAMDKYNVYQQGFADTLRNLGVGNAEDVIARASAGEDLYGMIGSIVDPNEMAQAVDQMDDYISNMMSSLEDAQDSVDQAFEKVKDLFNENVKQMDTYIEKIEFCQKITKSYMNIVDIVGKKSLGITNEMLRTFNAESVTQAVNNEAAAKAKMDSIQAQLLESQTRLAQASGELEQKYWNEIIEEQEKELISATENFHQAWEDALQANLEAFENNIELVIEDFSNAVGDLNAMKAEWDLQKSLTDMWEPEYERWHQLSDLINDINKSVDENENLKYKQDLLDLETEIEQLQEQEAKLSEYDLNYLRLRYESKLAEIALEEAQAAKSQVRMSRDNEGNYSYVYTADEEAVNNAADDYRNKIYEMEKANEEYIDTLQQQLLEMHDKMLEDIQQAGELYGVGTQAYYDAVARIQETYVGQSEFIQLQMQNVFTNNQRLRDEDIVQYVAYTGDIAAENVDLQTSFGDTYMGIQTQTDDLQTYFNDTWLPALNETFDNVILKAEEYSQQNEAAMETAGTTMDGFRDRASQDILEVTERTTELTEETQRYGETAVDQFAKAAQAWQTGPGALLDAINAQATAIANLAQQYTSLKSQLDAAAQAARDFAAAMGQRASVSPSIPSVSPTSSGSGGGGGSSYNSGGGPGIKDSFDNNSRNNAGIYQAISQLENGPHNSSTRDQLIALYNQIGRPESQWVAWARPGAKFDTGGYTGEWGDDGRLAVLHQKELVLNAKDTSNILTAVDVVRQLASSIDFNTMTASLATANIKSASGNSGTLEQKVEITANFPNATDRNEIEQAFQNIVNMASQYAQRKND